MRLDRLYVEKPWGVTDLPPMFDQPAAGKRIGEVWFTGAGDQPLLVKWLFTSERLSVQVHPNDDQARARGIGRGKRECWFVVDSQPGATLGLGLKRDVAADDLRKAALDGSIEQMLDWHPVRSGDFFLVPPGTIHAIGGGISLIEFQQSSDVTYRLYDYGRGRPLHLDEGLAVARREPYPPALAQHLEADEHRILVDGPDFILVQASQDALTDRRRWVIPLRGEVRSEGECARPGDVLLAEAGQRLESEDARLLVGAVA